MNPDDIVFTSTIPERNLTITLKEGLPDKYGRQHIIHRRKFMESKIDCVKYAVENADIAIMDKGHQDRERVYCLGADSTHPELYMTVVVGYENEYNGTIITAFPEDNIPEGGVINYVKLKR